jgi:hypothetical protein
MARLTPEREKEIRGFLYHGEICSPYQSLHECIQEIDALREELAQVKTERDDAIRGESEISYSFKKILYERDSALAKLKIAEDFLEDMSDELYADGSSTDEASRCIDVLQKIRGTTE